jgi:ABC-type multidrug transport system ATPase subunit
VDTIGIEGHHLHKRFGETTALTDVSITAEAGQIVALLGPNGAGKTTLLQVLGGLCVADSGCVRVRGPSPHPESVLAYVPDELGFWPHLSGLENLRTLLEMSAARLSAASLVRTMEAVGLAKVAVRRCGGYSLGERRRLALALLLARQPRVLLLDEPTVGLDLDGVRLFREALRRFRGAGCAIVLSSHQLTEVERLADTVAFMEGGTLTDCGALAPLLEGYGKWHLRVEEPTRLLEALRGIPIVSRVTFDGEMFGVWAKGDPTRAVMEVVRSHGTTIRQWSFVPATLEDIWPLVVRNGEPKGAVADAEG